MLISICIPVYNGEKYLRKCLDSIAVQGFKDFEIVVVDDGSTGQNEKGWNCKKICKVFTKDTKVKVNYLRNNKNLGSLEARRNAIYEAKGEYILCVDCDDVLEPDCLSKFAEKTSETKADIIQCGAKVSKNNQLVEEKANLLFEGRLTGKEIFENSIESKKINFFLWGKLIKRDLFITAWESIPPCYCVWGEDFLIYFYLAYFAQSYFGFKDKLYVYSVDTGISSVEKIDSLEKWEKLCSVSSAFAIIFDSINNETTTVKPEQRDAIQRQCNTYALLLFRYLKEMVTEDIREEAFNIFCEYWGNEYIQKILEASGESK